MKKSPQVLIALYIGLDIVAIGMGMGVPFFCILFGIPAGWVLGGYLLKERAELSKVLSGMLFLALVMTAISALVLVLIWTPSATMLFDPAADLANYGIPMILYTPLASFIGWMGLMMIVSPGLQFLMILFGFYFRVLYSLKRKTELVTEEHGALG